MGARVDLLRALIRHRPGMLVAAGMLTGCIDFVEPDLPQRGAPATIEAMIIVADTGMAELNAVLVPGLDQSGRQRTVRRDSVEVMGRVVAPDSIHRNGTRRYVEAWPVPPAAVAGPIAFAAPSLDRLTASPPAVAWSGVERVGPAVIDAERGDDLFLLVAAGSSTTLPEPEIRQWFLRLAGDSSAFGLSADGAPPDTIFVPARWIPEADSIAVRLIFSQSAVIRPPPGDYVGVIRLDTRLYWTVRLRDPGSPVHP